MRILTILKIFILVSVFGTFSSYAVAGSFLGTVTDQSGNPLEHAVITLVGDVAGLVNESVAMTPPVMAQHNIQFTPFVLPVAAGTLVSFPNKDKVRHHVYSFSNVKRFELELYGEDEEKAVLFDEVGTVALGCNIHDNMLAYIYIARSNSFSKSGEDGKVSIEKLEPGTYQAYVWHPRLKGSDEDYQQSIVIGDQGTIEANFEISLKRERNRRRSDY